jgi:hypothetical protein
LQILYLISKKDKTDLPEVKSLILSHITDSDKLVDMMKENSKDASLHGTSGYLHILCLLQKQVEKSYTLQDGQEIDNLLIDAINVTVSNLIDTCTTKDAKYTVTNAKKQGFIDAVSEMSISPKSVLRCPGEKNELGAWRGITGVLLQLIYAIN